jgi:pyruvyltransferase
MRTKTVLNYRWTGEFVRGRLTASNWGDELGPLLLKRFAGVSSELAEFTDAQIVTVGSVLQLMPPGWPGVIAGAGKLRADSPFLPSRKTKIVALRGPLTARGIPGSYAIGDPGILADELLDRIPDKKHDLGIVAHWSDKELFHRPEFQRYRPLLISSDGDPLDVIRQIGECRKIVSSSLHGIIVADAFGIPRRIEEMKLTSRDTAFKFRDYHASISHPYVVGKTTTPQYSRVLDRKSELWHAFRSLKAALK